MSSQQKIDYSKIISAGIVVGIVIALFFISSARSGITGNAVRDLTSYEVLTEDDFLFGTEEATISIIAFYDLNDPYTRRFHNEVFPSIKRDYIDTGKAKFIIKDLPLHEDSLLAAQSLECVRKEYGDEAYWNYLNVLFKKQDIADSGIPGGAVTRKIPITQQDLINWARGDESDNFEYNIESCLTNKDTLEEVAQDKRQATNFGINIAPSFIINSQIIEGSQQYEVFKNALDKSSIN